MPKRILIFSLTYHPFIGGAEIAVKETTDRIDPEEYAFDMITIRFDSGLPKFERIGHIDVFRIGIGKKGADTAILKRAPLSWNKYLYPFLAFAAATVLHRRKPYDAIMTTMTSHASFAALFFKWFHPSVPYLCRCDDGDPTEYLENRVKYVFPGLARVPILRHIWRLSPLYFFYKKIFSDADRAVVTSNYLLRFIRSMGYTGDSIVVPNGVDVARFSALVPVEQIAAIRVKIGRKKDDIFLITTSRLVTKNAVDDVIRALPQLPPYVHFLILGIGPDEEMLKRLAKEKGVSSRTHFLGQIANTELPAYLKSCDIFIRPSLSEGFGISFIEAMVAGLPVIGTQEGGIADFLYDAKKDPDHMPTGWAVAPRDPAGIAQAVEDILSDPEKVHVVLENARIMAAKRYDWSIIAQHMRENVLGPLVGSSLLAGK